jgi:hypothetical protein
MSVPGRSLSALAITARQVSHETAVAVGIEVLVEVTGDELDDGAALESDHGVTLPPW